MYIYVCISLSECDVQDKTEDIVFIPSVIISSHYKMEWLEA